MAVLSGGRAAPAPIAIPAAESALGSHLCVALSSAQVLPGWTKSTSPCNNSAANGDYSLTSCLTPGVHFTSLLRTHAPTPLTLPSFSFCFVRGVFAGCYQPLLPAGSSRRYLCESFLGCLVPYHGGSHRVPLPVSSSVSSAFPNRGVGRLTRFYPRTRFSAERVFEAADISLCSGLRVCSPPRSFLPLRIQPQGS